jgi:hypothetical protein
MAGFTNAVAATTLDTFISDLSTNCYLALYTVIPGENGTGGTEANYTGYARQQVTSWNSATIADPSVKSNNGQINFPQCTAGSNTIVGWAIVNALSGGTVQFVGSFTSSLGVSNGITPIIGDEDLELRLD